MKILLPLDGSDRSETILATAQKFADAEFVLLKVTEHYGLVAPDLPSELGLDLQQRAQTRSRNYLASLEKRFPGAKTRFYANLGLPRDEIVRLARREKCDLIMLNSHQRDGVLRWMLGSVAEGVLRTAPCPVLLLRPDRPAPALFQNVVVPVDGSAASLEVVRRIGPFLAPEARVTLLRSSQLSAYPYLYSFSTEEAERYCLGLERELQGVAVPGLNLEVVVLEGDPVECILEWSKSHGCDLIAMSTHGRTGFRRVWMGSVTEKVARHSESPVLVFRLPRVSEPVPPAAEQLVQSRV